jgi:hypothetical protein
MCFLVTVDSIQSLLYHSSVIILYGAARGEVQPAHDCEVDFSTRINTSGAHRETGTRDRRSPSPRPRSVGSCSRSPSAHCRSDNASLQPPRRRSPTYEPFHAQNQATSFEDVGKLHDGYRSDVDAPMSQHEWSVLERKQQHHEAFEARRERLEEEEELERQRHSVMKEKMASVQQEVAAERQAGSSQMRSNPVDSKRRKALLEKIVAKKVSLGTLQACNSQKCLLMQLYAKLNALLADAA